MRNKTKTKKKFNNDMIEISQPINELLTSEIQLMRSEKKIEHLNLILRAIRNVNQIITREKDRDKLIQAACSSLIENRGYHNAWIALLDDSGKLVTSAEAGLGKSFFPIVERLKRGKLTRCGQKVLKQSKIVSIKNPSSTCADCPLAKKYAGRGAMTVRLKYGKKVYGLISVSTPREFAADKEEQSLFQEIARDIAFALHTIELEEERKRAEEAIKNSEGRLRILFEYAPDAYYLNDLKGTFIDGNKAAEKLTGYKRKELIGKSFLKLNLLPLEQIPKAAALLSKNILGKTTGPDEFSLIRKDGIRVSVEIRTFPVKIEGQTMVLGIARDITERKRAEESLAAEKERLAVTLHSIGDGVIATDTEGKVILMNKVAEELTGQTEKEAVGKPLNKVFYIISEKTRKQCVNPVERVMKEGVVIGLANNTVLISKDGTERFIADSGAPIHDKEGIIIGVILVFRDVTEKRRAEEALMQQKHALGERVKELSCLYGLDKLSRKEGIAIEEVLKRAVRLIPYSWQYPKITGCRITFENKKYKTKNFKETKWMQGADIIINNKKAGLLEVCYLEERPESDEGPFLKEERNLIKSITRRLGQIVEQKKAEEALRRSENKYRTLMENLPQKIFLKDPKSVYISCNKNYARDLKINPNDITSKTDYDFYPKELAEKYRTDDKRIMESGKVEDIEERYIQNGEEVWVHTVKTPVKDEKGNRVSILGIFWDITDRKKAEEQIETSLREKEVLLREIHHRVKNNLQVISSLLNLQSYHIKGKQNKELFKESQNRIKSIALIHEKLYQSKDLARINFKEYTEALVSSLFRSYGYSAGKVVLNIEAEKVSLGIDNAIPCGLIINELVSNSLKHAFPDGRKGEIKIGLHSSNEKDVELEVSDNGVGIPEDLDLRKTKSLGLHLVTILAEDQLHGRIRLSRKKGTKFQIKFSAVK